MLKHLLVILGVICLGFAAFDRSYFGLNFLALGLFLIFLPQAIAAIQALMGPRAAN
jgi:hypothetical protein